MSNSVQNISKVNNGLCPHGMSPGSCPICSGMGGGGRVGERPQKAGEMSYHQCAMIGAMMKARAARIEAHEQNLQQHKENLAAFDKNMVSLAAKMAEFATKISNNFLFRPVAYTINNIVVPIINTIRNIPNIVLKITNLINQIKDKVIDIQDKLNAIFGEAKAFVEKKVSEFTQVIKSKLDSIFNKIFGRNNTKDDETKIDEDKKIFNLKKFINKIWKKKKDDREDNARS